jgi:hypothetical protein
VQGRVAVPVLEDHGALVGEQGLEHLHLTPPHGKVQGDVAVLQTDLAP